MMPRWSNIGHCRIAQRNVFLCIGAWRWGACSIALLDPPFACWCLFFHGGGVSLAVKGGKSTVGWMQVQSRVCRRPPARRVWTTHAMAQRVWTNQDRIDEATMRIEDPSRVTGSGYIQFPPQRPFERPVQAQPPTLSQYEYPEAYGNGNGPAAQGYAPSYLPPQTRPMTTTNLQPQQQQQPRYTHHAPSSNVQQRNAAPMQAPMRPPTHKVPPMQPTHPPTRVLQKSQGHQIAAQPAPHAMQQEHPYKTQRPMQKVGHTRPTMQPASVPHPTPRNGPANPPGSTAAVQPSHATRQAAAPPPAETPSAPVDSRESKAKLSKSQAKRMRKKMRESQGVAGNL